jgi:hypothetical protein
VTHDTVNWTSTTGFLAMLPVKYNILHQLFQFVSKGSDQELPAERIYDACITHTLLPENMY